MPLVIPPTPRVMLPRVDRGHCGGLITGVKRGGDALVMAPCWVSALWDVGSGSGFYKRCAPKKNVC